MATCTHKVGTANTAATPATSGAFTPAVGDLLIVFCIASGTVDNTYTCSSSIGGFTFTQITKATYAASANRIFAFVANALVTSATSQTVTITAVADQATGTVIFVNSVAGMTKTGLTAIRQSTFQDDQGAGGTPTPVFASACLTGNPTLGTVGNNSNPAGMTTPTGWAEQSDLGYITPTTGGEYVTRDSGFTGTSVTWGNTSATVFGSIAVELDSSGSSTRVKDIIGGFGIIPSAR